MTICDVILSAVIGVGTGALSSWMVARETLIKEVIV